MVVFQVQNPFTLTLIFIVSHASLDVDTLDESWSQPDFNIEESPPSHFAYRQDTFQNAIPSPNTSDFDDIVAIYATDKDLQGLTVKAVPNIANDDGQLTRSVSPPHRPILLFVVRTPLGKKN